MLAKRSRGLNMLSRVLCTWFSTCPFSHPAAGVQATGSTRWWSIIVRKRRLKVRSLPANTAVTAVFMLS
jgi:hypothetical protein